MADKRITDVDFIESLNSDESFFINQNSALRQIKRSNVVFNVANGGTGATNVEDARINLGVAAADHEHTAAEVGAIPATGGKMTGDLKMSGDIIMTGDITMNSGNIILKEGVNYGSESQMPTAGVKGRIFLKKI